MAWSTGKYEHLLTICFCSEFHERSRSAVSDGDDNDDIPLLDDVKNDDIKNPAHPHTPAEGLFLSGLKTPSPATMMEKIWGTSAIPKLGCLYFMALPQ